MNINIDMDSILNFAQNNDFVVTVFVIATILVIAGFIFRTFLKAAIVTAAILILSSLLIQLIPESEGHLKNISNEAGQIVNQGKNYIDEQIKNKIESDENNNLGNITDE